MFLENVLVQFASSKTLWPTTTNSFSLVMIFDHLLTLRFDAPRESSVFYVLHPEPFDISLDLMSLVNLLVQFASSKTLWQFFNRYYHQQLEFGHDLWPFTYLTLRYDAPSESSGFYVLHPEPFDIRSLLCSSCTQKNHFFTLLSWLVTRKSLTLWVVVIYNKQQHIQTNKSQYLIWRVLMDLIYVVTFVKHK
jgi:hypothetical protein